jgi:LacI family transcriptional regulator
LRNTTGDPMKSHGAPSQDAPALRRGLPVRSSSIREVAARAGVSVGTVSNVLNRPELVAETTRSRVRLAIDELGYVLNDSARQLRAGRSRAIGAVVLDVANPFFTEVVRGVEDTVSTDGYVVILCSSDDSAEKEGRYLRLLEEQRVLGVLITPVHSDSSYLRRLCGRGIRVVLLDRPSSSKELCSVAVDDVLGGELAASHLLAQGHTRLGFVNGPVSIRQCADRRRGVRRAVRAAGLDPRTAVVEVTRPALNAHQGEASVAALLAARPRPTAVFCANDLLALGVLRGLAAKGLAVPDDLALVGYDDIEVAAMLSTPLTSVRQPKYQLGQAAAELLLAEAHEPDTHRHAQTMFQPELVVRESSATRVLRRSGRPRPTTATGARPRRPLR